MSSSKPKMKFTYKECENKSRDSMKCYNDIKNVWLKRTIWLFAISLIWSIVGWIVSISLGLSISVFSLGLLTGAIVWTWIYSIISWIVWTLFIISLIFFLLGWRKTIK